MATGVIANAGLIPEPPKRPIIGNMLTVDKDRPLQGLMEMTRRMGPIFRLDMMGTPIVVVSGADLVAELCDERRFDKAVRGSLRRVRVIAGDGLFTADSDAENWGKAHNILLPTFSRRAMNNYMPMMLDVVGQLCAKWERLNADDEIDVVHDMTAVALDTIGLCGFDYRFNSFYRRDYHPFIDALTRSLETCMVQRGLPFEQTVLRRRLRQLEADAAYMNKLVDDIIAERRKGGGKAANDLLNYMLEGVDRTTGESLSDENIRYQINTFLIAGHETTSGLMSFTLYFLLNHPDVLERAYREVDEVLGRDIAVQPTIREVNRLTYIQQILFEALRLWPTAPAIALSPYEDELLGGRYKLKKGAFTTLLTLMLHRDKSVWGENAEAFDPEQFSRDAMAGRPAHAYKPFGNGKRACIGRQFAIQEATLAIGMILQRFELIDHANYRLKIRESLSIKPDGFRMKVRLRPEITRSRLVPGGVDHAEAPAESLAGAAARPTHGAPALVLFGSNLGTTEEFAREIARRAEAAGFETTLAPLDEFAGRLPQKGAVIVACASYNGAPPDNAVAFLEWVEGAPEGAGEGVSYAVLGCGHSDWSATFQAVPRRIDAALERIGARRVAPRAETDAKEDIDEAAERWIGGLFPALAAAFGLSLDLGSAPEAGPRYRVEFIEDAPEHALIRQFGAKRLTIAENRELQAEGSPRSTRHVEVKLEPGMTWRAGDHLAVLPRNEVALVVRVEARFGLGPETRLRLSAGTGAHGALPLDTPLSARELLSEMLELQGVASRKDVAALARATECPRSKPELERLAGPAWREEVSQKRRSALDLLERFPACEFPFADFLGLCAPLQPRYYSISSSPRAAADRCAITVGVVDGPHLSGEGRYRGACTTFLAAAGPGRAIHAAIRPTRANFILPDDPFVPLVMIGPGTGLAPFRAFCQERAALAAEGAPLGPAILYFGCRAPEEDFIYRDELEAWAASGVIELRTAFSRTGPSKTYVQDLMREDGAKLWPMLEAGGRVFVCGDGARMEPDVRRMLQWLHGEATGAAPEASAAWLDGLIAAGRYNLDVWVGS